MMPLMNLSDLRRKFLRFGILVLATGLSACGAFLSDESDESEFAQHVGDLMASFDEGSGTSTGSFGLVAAVRKQNLPALLSAKVLGFPEARTLATDCEDVAFSACTLVGADYIRTRDFGGCTTSGGYTVTGDVTLDFSHVGCTMNVGGRSVTRTPNILIEGRRGATLEIYGTSPAQSITVGGGYTFTSNSIRRVFSTPTDGTILDFTTETTQDIVLTGSTRTARAVTSGEITVTNEVSAETCVFTPSNLGWSSDCRCPTSGRWTGTCSVGGSAYVSFDGCGSASFFYGGDSEGVSLDRCY
jgi:hypothetical protein